jgi:hypothetical protein
MQMLHSLITWGGGGNNACKYEDEIALICIFNILTNIMTRSYDTGYQMKLIITTSVELDIKN